MAEGFKWEQEGEGMNDPTRLDIGRAWEAYVEEHLVGVVNDQAQRLLDMWHTSFPGIRPANIGMDSVMAAIESSMEQACDEFQQRQYLRGYWGDLMAWDYEKNCEMPDAYAFGKSTIYSPPNWGLQVTKEALDWTRAELDAAHALVRASAHSAMGMASRQCAIAAWERLEYKMVITDWGSLSQIPELRRKYMEWLSREKIADVVTGTTEVDLDALPLLERIVAEGYRSLAKKSHPDAGGTADQFNDLKTAKTQMDEILREIKSLL